VATGSLAKVSRTAESALGLYGGARAVAAATTVGVVSRGARLGARSLVGSVDEFSQAAFAGLRRGLSRLSGASQYAVIRQVRSVPDGVRSRVATAGVSDQLVGYVARTGSDGTSLLGRLDGDTQVGLLKQPRGVQRAFARADVCSVGGGASSVGGTVPAPGGQLAFSLSAPDSLTALDDGCSPGELSDEQVEKAIDELDAAEENRDVARRAIREGGDNAIQVIAELDDPTVLYEFVEEGGEDATDLLRQVNDPDELTTVLTDIGETEQVSALASAIADDTLPLAALLNGRRGGEYLEIRFGDETVQYRVQRSATGTDEDVDVKADVLYPDDVTKTFSRAAARDTYSDAEAGEYVDPDDPEASWERLDDRGDRFRFVERKLAPYVLEEEYGLDILCVETGCGAEANGIDLIAWDPTRERLVVVETKWTGDDEPVTAAKLGDARSNTKDSEIQGTDGWIASSWEEGRDQQNIQLRESVESKQAILDIVGEDTLEEAVNTLIQARSFDSGYFFASDSVGDETVSNDFVTRGGLDGNPPVDLYVNGEFDTPSTEGIFDADRTYHFKSGRISDDE
jgi:hypothetical protein